MRDGEARFIGEAIEVQFCEPPLYAKRPGCPDSFVWQGVRHRIVKLEREWHDHERRGRMARNMRPDHAAAAAARGSWGVGRVYFRVRTEENRVFDLYYDRAPGGGGRRRGGWYLFREIVLDHT
jgi:hypothetical protein